MTASRRHVEALKTDWLLAQGNYDLYAVPGYEEYEEDLREFQRVREEHWCREHIARVDEKANSLGVDGNLAMAWAFLNVEERLHAIEVRIER